MNKTYEPKYIMWYENEFSADPYVSRGMRPMHRHFYRALIIAACYNSARPYLPNDDNLLWILADAETPEQWLQHKDVVMKKFTLTADSKHWQHKRVMADWQKMLNDYEQRVAAGKKTRFPKQNAAGAGQPPCDPSAGAGLSAERPTANRTGLDFELDGTQPNPTQHASSQNELAGWEGWILQPSTTDVMGVPTDKEQQELKALASKELNGFKFLTKAVGKFRDRPNGFGGLTKASPWRLFIQQAPTAMAIAKTELMASGEWCRENIPGERERQDASIARQTAELPMSRSTQVEENWTLDDFMAVE